MSLALATKGMIAGLGGVGGGGGGGDYPAGYIASAIFVAVDLSSVTDVDVLLQDIEVDVDVSEGIAVEVDKDTFDISVSVDDENLEVET
jgi:hypothetical protein